MEEDKDAIRNILQVSEVKGRQVVRLPSMVGRNKKAILGYLRDKVWRKLQQWHRKHLSKARREIVIKSVA